ncbi:MAG: hypothetical protein CSA62_06860 [Planctomycetota bacterium]|nr:MAG: hypothetical protein CSA62_06860 [Planctomycetota bacterium]
MSQSEQQGSQSRISYGSGAWLVAPVFFALAAWFLWGPQLAAYPKEPVHRISKARIMPVLRRAVLGDPPQLMINGFERSCMDCHRTFLTKQPKAQGLMQHQHVVLVHGPNTSCMDCHDYEDRDKLKLNGGGLVSFRQTAQLCASCHVDIYSDWTRGIHGKAFGSWQKGSPERRQLGCTECHDPHMPRHPAMAAIRPLPGPNTLRMGKRGQGHAEDEHQERDPLRKALQHYKQLEKGEEH